MSNRDEWRLFNKLQKELLKIGYKYDREEISKLTISLFESIPERIRPANHIQVLKKILKEDLSKLFQNAEDYYSIFVSEFDLFYTREELQKILTDFIDLFRVNKDSLLKTGYPIENIKFSHWFSFYLNKNYFTKISYYSPWEIEFFKTHEFSNITNVEYRNTSNYFGNDLGCPSNEVWVKNVSRLRQYFGNVVYGKIDEYNQLPVAFCDADFVNNLDAKDVDFLEREVRPRMFELKIKILTNCLQSLSNFEKERFVNKSFNDMLDTMGVENIRRLFELEKKVKRHSEKYKMSGFSQKAMLPNAKRGVDEIEIPYASLESDRVTNFFFDFGLENIIKLIWHVHEEITIGRYYKVTEERNLCLEHFNRKKVDYFINHPSYLIFLFGKKEYRRNVDKVLKKHRDLDEFENKNCPNWRRQTQNFRSDLIVPEFESPSHIEYHQSPLTRELCESGNKKKFVCYADLRAVIDVSRTALSKNHVKLVDAGLCKGKPNKLEYALCDGSAKVYHDKGFFKKCKLL